MQFCVQYFDIDIVHIVHIARVLRYCTYCQHCTIIVLLDIAHKIAQVWFADARRPWPGGQEALARRPSPGAGLRAESGLGLPVVTVTGGRGHGPSGTPGLSGPGRAGAGGPTESELGPGGRVGGARRREERLQVRRWPTVPAAAIPSVSVMPVPLSR